MASGVSKSESSLVASPQITREEKPIQTFAIEKKESPPA
jgi:hypothetical protein